MSQKSLFKIITFVKWNHVIWKESLYWNNSMVIDEIAIIIRQSQKGCLEGDRKRSIVDVTWKYMWVIFLWQSQVILQLSIYIPGPLKIGMSIILHIIKKSFRIQMKSNISLFICLFLQPICRKNEEEFPSK